ncbi:MAG: hypothetical protein A4E49_01623 [Methanosaeta sp. PtaU1.Bin112]|nr:MAG: hypothetical protein A4E49_01623 [Methanosaeta sp. PtaU1.Bin112]
MLEETGRQGRHQTDSQTAHPAASCEVFIKNNNIINKEIYKGIIIGSVLQAENPEEIYLTLFSVNSIS